MNCPKCGGPRTLLFVSYVCDACEPPTIPAKMEKMMIRASGIPQQFFQASLGGPAFALPAPQSGLPAIPGPRDVIIHHIPGGCFPPVYYTRAYPYNRFDTSQEALDYYDGMLKQASRYHPSLGPGQSTTQITRNARISTHRTAANGSIKFYVGGMPGIANHKGFDTREEAMEEFKRLFDAGLVK